MANVYSLVAAVTGYQNANVSGSKIPLTNITGTIPGPLNPEFFVPFLAPNLTAVGAGGGPVFVAPGLNTNLTTADAPAPVNLTAMHQMVPASGPDTTTPTGSSLPLGPTASGSSGSGSGSQSSGARQEFLAVGVAVFSTLAAFGGSFVLFV